MQPPQASALTGLLALAEQETQLDRQNQQLATDVQSRRSRLDVMGMTLRREQDKLAKLEKRSNPDDAPALSRLADARQESEHTQLVEQLEQTLRGADSARRDAQRQRTVIQRDAATLADRLPPHASRIHRQLLDRGVRWPVVRATSSECGGCAASVPPQPQDEPWVCPACGRLLAL